VEQQFLKIIHKFLKCYNDYKKIDIFKKIINTIFNIDKLKLIWKWKNDSIDVYDFLESFIYKCIQKKKIMKISYYLVDNDNYNILK